MSDIVHDWLGSNRNTTTSGFRAFHGEGRQPERVTDQDRRAFLRGCGLIRNPHVDELVQARQAAGDHEVSLASLEAFATELGASEHVDAARRELSAAFEAADDGQTLRSLRLRLGMSQKRLAAALGTSQPRIATIEAGRQSMTLPFARRLAEVLQVSLDVLAKAEARRPRA